MNQETKNEIARLISEGLTSGLLHDGENQTSWQLTVETMDYDEAYARAQYLNK